MYECGAFGCFSATCSGRLHIFRCITTSRKRKPVYGMRRMEGEIDEFNTQNMNHLTRNRIYDAISNHRA